MSYFGPNWTPRPLADGVLTDSTAAIYTVKTGFRAIVTNVVYFNTDASARTVYMHVDDGTSRQMFQQSLDATSRLIIIDSTAPLLLLAGDIIKGHASLTNVVNYFVYGWLESER